MKASDWDCDPNFFFNFSYLSYGPRLVFSKNSKHIAKLSLNFSVQKMYCLKLEIHTVAFLRHFEDKIPSILSKWNFCFRKIANIVQNRYKRQKFRKNHQTKVTFESPCIHSRQLTSLSVSRIDFNTDKASRGSKRQRSCPD